MIEDAVWESEFCRGFDPGSGLEGARQTWNAQVRERPLHLRRALRGQAKQALPCHHREDPDERLRQDAKRPDDDDGVPERSERPRGADLSSPGPGTVGTVVSGACGGRRLPACGGTIGRRWSRSGRRKPTKSFGGRRLPRGAPRGDPRLPSFGSPAPSTQPAVVSRPRHPDRSYVAPVAGAVAAPSVTAVVPSRRLEAGLRAGSAGAARSECECDQRE